MKKVLYIICALAIILSLSACGNEKSKDENKSSLVEAVASSNTSEETVQSTFVETTSKDYIPPTKPDTTYLVPNEDRDKWTSDVFIIKEVNGTNLKMEKMIIGTNDTEKQIYSCDYGELSGSADMIFNVGDAVTVVYGKDVMETYPMQITIKEIYPASYNN